MVKKLLFVDTNIWLDFYRTRNDAGLQLLNHLEAISDKLIITHQLETEFKKNRQKVIVESIQALKVPENISRPAFLSDAQAAKTLNTKIKGAGEQVTKLKNKLKMTLDNPSLYDPVYQACQRIFRSNSQLILSREDKHRGMRSTIRRRALRRFLHGCPPRKSNDTSMGDALNWEWMIECAINHKVELVIVSRDADYGIEFDKKSYVNDHLQQEFKERVSKKRKVHLYTKLTEALNKEFKVSVTEQEKEEEDKIIVSSQTKKKVLSADKELDELLKKFLTDLSPEEIDVFS